MKNSSTNSNPDKGNKNEKNEPQPQLCKLNLFNNIRIMGSTFGAL